MKKTLSLVLALALALAMFSSFALIADPAGTTDSLKLASIMVSDANGYANPYAAVDNAAAFVENQAAYVVVTFNVLKDDDLYDDHSSVLPHVVTITSSTLDLSYAIDTDKKQAKIEGVISASAPVLVSTEAVYTASTAKLVYTLTGAVQPTVDNDVNKYYYAFIAVTKPAAAGMVQASMAVSPTEFATTSSIFTTMDATTSSFLYSTRETSSVLVVYVEGVAKYTIVNTDITDGGSYMVFAGKSVKDVDFLFTYVQGATFTGIGYPMGGSTIPFTYNAKIVYLGADGLLGTTDDKDLTDTVAAVNAFFGYSFMYNNAVKDTNFEAKTAGDPIVVSDTYAYFTAVVTDGDGVDIAPTGDFSANIVIVMAASAVLAAAALAFVAKKARD